MKNKSPWGAGRVGAQPPTASARAGDAKALLGQAVAFHRAGLLGVRGACVVAHGRSNRLAIRNAIRNAATLAEKNLVGTIEHAIASSLAQSEAGTG